MKANCVSFLLKKRRNGVLGFIDCCIVLRCCKWSVRFIISVPLLHVSVVMTIGPPTESRPRSKQYTISQTAKAHCCCNIPNNPCTIPSTYHTPATVCWEGIIIQLWIPSQRLKHLGKMFLMHPKWLCFEFERVKTSSLKKRLLYHGLAQYEKS